MKCHLIGIGGVGMSALATALLRQGHVVTGADRTLGTPNIRFLESLGVKVFPDDGSGVDATTDEVVISTAIEETNAGLRKAAELGIPVTHRAKALARALAGYKLVAVVGTCGKSTVTAMLGHVLVECGLDPMCVNGANVPGWEGAVRFGRGAYAVAEVDESDKSLVAFSPYAAVVTNASADHYSKEEMDEVFDAFVKDCEGPVIDGRGNLEPLAGLEKMEVPLPGAHNRQNAEMAVRMAVALGIEPARAVAAMKTFGGVERRLQLITPADKPSDVQAFEQSPAVYDDYAHNPEKIRAMWLTLAEKYPKGICVIWRPHGYGPLRKLKEGLADMFKATIRPQDRLLLLPVYDAGGTANRGICSADLAKLLPCEKVILIDSLDAAYTWCLLHRVEFGAFVTCGARDPGLPVLARRLSEI